MTRRGAIATAIAFAAVAACSSFGGTPANGVSPGSDASAPDASPSDLPDGTTSPDANNSPAMACPAGAELCDDFESGHVDPTRWQDKTITNGTLDIVPSSPGENGAASNMALRATRFADGGRADLYLIHRMQVSAHPFPVTIAARAWVKIANQLGNGVYTLTLSSPGSSFEPFLHSAIADPNTGNWGIESTIDNGSYKFLPSNAQVKVGTWTCLELVAMFPSTADDGHLTLFVDDQPGLDQGAQTYNSSDNFTEIFLTPGLIDSDNAAAQSTDVDNVVLRVLSGVQPVTKPIIGCQ